MNAREQNFCKIARRPFLAVFSSLGLGSALLPGALAAASQGQHTITTAMMRQAELTESDQAMTIADSDFHLYITAKFGLFKRSA